MTRTEYFETAQRLYNEGKISAEAYDALWLNAEEFIDEDDDDRIRFLKEETAMYKYMSARTGELVTSLKEVFRVIWWNLRHYHILDLVWKYNKKGW